MRSLISRLSAAKNSVAATCSTTIAPSCASIFCELFSLIHKRAANFHGRHPGIGPVKALGRSHRQPAAFLDNFTYSAARLGARRLVEIDHDIAAKHQVIRTELSRRFQQIECAELHEPAQRFLDQPSIVSRLEESPEP